MEESEIEGADGSDLTIESVFRRGGGCEFLSCKAFDESCFRDGNSKEASASRRLGLRSLSRGNRGVRTRCRRPLYKDWFCKECETRVEKLRMRSCTSLAVGLRRTRSRTWAAREGAILPPLVSWTRRARATTVRRSGRSARRGGAGGESACRGNQAENRVDIRRDKVGYAAMAKSERTGPK